MQNKIRRSQLMGRHLRRNAAHVDYSYDAANRFKSVLSASTSHSYGSGPGSGLVASLVHSNATGQLLQSVTTRGLNGRVATGYQYIGPYSGRIPDLIGFGRHGRFDAVEVMSDSDWVRFGYEGMLTRIDEAMSELPPYMQGKSEAVRP